MEDNQKTSKHDEALHEEAAKEHDSGKTMDDEEEFKGTTSRSTWEKLINTADRLLKSTLEAAGDAAQWGRIELEIASIKLRLKSLYSKLGDKVFHIVEAEEETDPLTDPEVQDLFEEIRITLSRLATEKRRLEKIREQSSDSSNFIGA